MYPILLSLGPLKLFSLSVFLVLSWLVFSFVFWKRLRGSGVEEERIFDLTFYATLVALVVSRVGFVAFQRELFTDNWLKIVAIWVQPGLSLYGALLGAVVTLIFLSRRFKVRLGYVLDALALSLPAALLVGELGALLDGSVVGKPTSLPWALTYVGHLGKRHPIQLYEMLGLLALMVLLWWLQQVEVRRKWPYGVLGVWFFFLYALIMFSLEFFKESSVYWISLSANQWILVGLFAESLGAFYVRGGGREALRPRFTAGRQLLLKVVQKAYAKISQRRPV